MEKYHIGQEILKEVKAKYPSVAAFARDLCKSSSATYEIFGKTSLDTDLLLKVSKLLGRDFFREFSDKCLNGEVTVIDKQTAENSITHLLPEDKLHIFSPHDTLDVVEEFLLLPRKKPLIVFYNSARSRRLNKRLYDLAEEILGEGMVRKMTVQPEELLHFELGIPSLTKLPHKAIMLVCRQTRDYDTHMLIAERLAAESDKHVIMLIHDPIYVPTMPNGIIVLKSFAVSTFNSWNERAHIFISDDRDKTFTYRIELYRATQGKGYMDRMQNSISGKCTWEETIRLLEEAKQNLSTYEDTLLGEGDYMGECHVQYHQVSTIQPSPSEMEKLDKEGHEILTHLRYRMIKETGKIIEFETMSFKQVRKMLDPTTEDNPIHRPTTQLMKEDKAIIKEAKDKKVSGEIYSEDGLRLLKVLGNPEYVVVKDGVKTICQEAFLGLDNLREVVLPASVISLGKRAFASCHSLFKITMPGVEFIGKESFARCESLMEIVLPETLEKIWDGAFAGCKALEQINIPSHMKVIDQFAFRNSGLKSLDIEISDGYKCKIYDRAFAYCKHLETVRLNKNVKIMERWAFAACTALKTIEFEKPSMTCSAGEPVATMLVGCTALEKIIVPKSKYNHYPDFNIQGYESAQFDTRDFNSLITPKE